jgi:hypothetical protein
MAFLGMGDHSMHGIKGTMNGQSRAVRGMTMLLGQQCNDDGSGMISI